MKRILLPLVAVLTFCGVVRAQDPIIIETSPPPPAPPKPKPRPRPAYLPPVLLWRTQVGRIDGTPVVSNEELYVGANGNLIALDTDGHIQWTTEVGTVQSSPVVGEKTVYVATARGILYALDRATGRINWKFITDGNASILTTPAIAGDRIVFEATDNNVYALSLKNGQLRWKFDRPDGSLGYSSPAADANGLFVAGETTLYNLDPATGNPIWKTFIGGKSLSAPALDRERVYIGADSRGVNAVLRKDGSTVWTFNGKSEGDWFGPPLLSSGNLYVSTYRRFVYSLDATTGRVRWSARVLGSALSQPAIDLKRNVVYITSTTFAENPTLTALEARTGKKLWEYALGYAGGSALIVGDRLFVGSTTGYLYAFKLR